MINSCQTSEDNSCESSEGQDKEELQQKPDLRVIEAIKFLSIDLDQSYSTMERSANLGNNTIRKMFAPNDASKTEEKGIKPHLKTLIKLEKLAYTPYLWIEKGGKSDDNARAVFTECIQKKLDGKPFEAGEDTWIKSVSVFVETYWSEIQKNFPDNFLLFIRLRKDISRIIDKRSVIKPLGMKYGVKIEEIYQEISVRYSDKQNNEEKITGDVTKKIVKKLCSSDPAKLIITGELGSGKTTMLLRIAKRISEKIDYVPIFFRFRRYVEAFNKGMASSILDFIVEDYFGKELENGFIDNLRLGKIVVMIDGIDEVPNDEKNSLTYSKLTQFIQRFHDAKFVVSCRNQEAWQNKNDQDWLNTFDQIIQLDELEEETSLIYMRKFFKNFNTEYTDVEMQKIKEKLKDLLNSNPLVLTIFCVSIISHKNNSKNDSKCDNYLDGLQMNKWNLIERCVYLILEEWNQVQDKDSIFWNLSFESKQLYLGDLALKVHETGECFFTWNGLREVTCDFFASSPNLNPIANIKDNFLVSEKIIDDLEQQQSLFVKKTDTQYGFTNELIRLWFAATTIRKKYGAFKLYSDDSLKKNFSLHFTDSLQDIYYELYPDEKSKTD